MNKFFDKIRSYFIGRHEVSDKEIELLTREWDSLGKGGFAKDRANLRMDVKNVGKDLNRAVEKYQLEHPNG